MNKNTNITLLSILALLTLSIFSAFIIEYGLGHKPCKLCLYQRYPYFISVFLILGIVIIKKYVKISLLILALVYLFGSIIAIFDNPSKLSSVGKYLCPAPISTIPIFLSPAAMQRLYHPEGDKASARAAEKFNTFYSMNAWSCNCSNI